MIKGGISDPRKQSIDENIQHDRHRRTRRKRSAWYFLRMGKSRMACAGIQRAVQPGPDDSETFLYEKQAEKTSRNGQTSKTIENKRQIMNYLATEGSSRAADIAEHIKLSLARTRVLLSELTNDGKMQTEGSGRTRRYLQKERHLQKEDWAKIFCIFFCGMSQPDLPVSVTFCLHILPVLCGFSCMFLLDSAVLSRLYLYSQAANDRWRLFRPAA